MSEDQAAGQEEVQVEQEQAQEEPKQKTKGVANLIGDTAIEVESMTKTKALNAAATLSDNIEANYFKLGGVLKRIADNTWFEGYESFDVFVFEKFGFQSRKARYLMQIYTDLVTKQIPWEAVKDLGWTKLKDLSPILTLENLDEWVAKASAPTTVLELQAMLKAKPEGAEKAKTTDEIVTLKFKLKADQAEGINYALAKAKGELGTEYDTVALENICAGYLADGKALTPTGDLKSIMQAAGWETALTTFGELFPAIDLTVDAQNA